MKFLCRNCKAKYQIADEKVAGRTLRMTCQQCGEAIAVRGPGRAAAQVSRPISQPLQPVALGAQQMPSALGADFQRQVAQPASDIPAARGGDEWHVAINDVPVGPMRREEVARKIAMGSVDREALAWREGMDDWMPCKHIPELAVLFAPMPGLAPPPPAAARALQPPPPVQPAARVEMAPIGGRQMLSLDDYAPPVPMSMDMATPAVTIQSMPSEAPAAAAKPLGWAQMFALVCGGALIMMLGAVLGVRVLQPQQPMQTGAHNVNTAATPEPVARPSKQNEPEETTGGNTIELDMQDINGTTGKPRATGTAPVVDKTKPAGKQLTDEQKAMLARMGGGGGDIKLNAPTADKPSGNSGGGTGQLTSEQLSRVVLGGRKNLQRCYETALRGANSDETVRLDVELEITPSGNVKSVHAEGKGLPGMDECIVRTVKMWHFPMSGESTQTRFPVVFQPGG